MVVRKMYSLDHKQLASDLHSLWWAVAFIEWRCGLNNVCVAFIEWTCVLDNVGVALIESSA